MGYLSNLNTKLFEFKTNQSGAFSMIWAICAAVLIGAMGMAADYALLTHANSRAQSITDTTALTAGIYVKNNEIIPTDREHGLIGTYSAQELGYEFSDWVIDGGDGVTVNIAYNVDNRETIVTTSGRTRPIFMQIFGYDALDFSVKSVVKFQEREPLDPASIVMVLDNSGSMHFDDNPLDADGNTPDGTQPRIDGLKTSANNFMALLDETVGVQDGSTGLPRVLRTGMMAFSGDIIAGRTVPMQWGTVPESSINGMAPDGATNSAPPLVVADTWLNINEPPIHEAENPSKTPLKYLILMTDGRNTVGTQEWVAREGTKNWRAWVPTTTTTTETREVVTGSSRQVVNRYVPDGNCAWESGYQYGSYWYYGSWGSWRHYNTSNRVVCEVETTETQEYEVSTTTYDWEYIQQEDEPTEPGDWEEGEFDITSNIATREQCDSLHTAGVEVFSIAYALAVGDYRTNDWGVQNFGDANHTEPTTEENSNDARAILHYCASKSENFITADNTEALDTAFERIGNTIIKEIIRIDS